MFIVYEIIKQSGVMSKRKKACFLCAVKEANKKESTVISIASKIDPSANSWPVCDICHKSIAPADVNTVNTTE